MTPSLAREAAETRELLAAVRAGLPKELQGPTQFLGRQYVGCGATIGAMPRCDFTCSGCYLGEGSNRIRPFPLHQVKEQIRRIRSWLGPAGNLQLTDGELTLRAEGELIELIAYARSIGLVPMLMTHGETFRRKPHLLERLVVEGGLSEVSFHVDTTMRGRRDQYAAARSEADLDDLRSEFAAMIRTVRKRTGRRLEAASTVTVTRHNLDAIPGLVRWFLRNADAFKMVSFQPVAAVGRTESGLEGVTADELWSRIAEGAGDPTLRRGEGWLGHPACSRFVQGLAVDHREGPRLVPLYRRDDSNEMQFLSELLERIGGTSFRLDTRGRAIKRAAGILGQHGRFLLTRGLPYLFRLGRRTRTRRARYFCIVSHHFMNATEIASTLGQERLSNCVFRVPIDGHLEPMCAVNALGHRERFYDSLQSATKRSRAA